MTQTLNWGVGSNDTVLLLTYFLNDPLELSVHVSTFPILLISNISYTYKYPSLLFLDLSTLCVTDHLWLLIIYILYVYIKRYIYCIIFIYIECIKYALYHIQINKILPTSTSLLTVHIFKQSRILRNS